eukprot:scaffold24280_cov55-Cyclotella_meneghiniana.AAC.4
MSRSGRTYFHLISPKINVQFEHDGRRCLEDDHHLADPAGAVGRRWGARPHTTVLAPVISALLSQFCELLRPVENPWNPIN